MTSTWWLRICGVLALLAAALGIALTVGRRLAPASVAPRAESLGYVVAGGFLLALLATAVAQWPRIGPVGRAGFVLALVADVVGIVPAIPSWLGSTLARLTPAHSTGDWVLWAAVVALAAGLLLSGGATLRWPALPRWTGAVLLAIGVLLLPEVVLFLPLARHYDAPLYQSLYSFLFTYAYPVLIPAAVDALWGVVGASLLLAASRPAAAHDVALSRPVGTTR